MSRIGSTFSKHRKDNYSLDIKNIYKTGIVQTPFAKKREGDDRFFTRLRTQIVHNTSHQQSSKQISRKQSRRLSLTKTFKMNNSVGVENHLAQQKFKRVKQFIAQGKYQECISIIRQLLMRQQNQYVRNKLFWLNAKCFQKIGKIKQAENFLTRLLNEEPDKYQALIERAKVRFALGAKQLSIRDIKHAIYVEPTNQQAYKQLCSIYLADGEQKQAYHIVSLAIEKGIDSVEMLITIVELLLTNPSISDFNVKTTGSSGKLVERLCRFALFASYFIIDQNETK